VDRPRAVHRYVIDHAALQEIVRWRLTPARSTCAAHEENARGAAVARGSEAGGHGGEVGVSEGRSRIGECKPAIEVQVVRALREGLISRRDRSKDSYRLMVSEEHRQEGRPAKEVGMI